VNPFRLVALLAVLLLVAVGVSEPAQKGESKLRTVHGTVINKDENPVPAAVVYLKNARTQNVQTHIADETGLFRFSGLDPNVDYEIHAESTDMVSNTRTISSFDSRKDMNVTLKLDKPKKKS
jgi:hypothetical protein